MLTNSSALGQSWVYVFGPETFTRKGSVQPTVYTRTFSARPDVAVVDIDDLGTVGADGSVTLNGVTLMDLRAVTGEVGPRHKSVNVTLEASNRLVVSLIGKNKSQFRVSVAQAVGRSCYPDLDHPELVLGSVVTSNGYDFYYLLVPNSDQFPAELFWPAPDLAPCGSYINASRTWVEVRSTTPPLLSAFCGLTSPEDLNTISFAVPTGTVPPSPIYVRLIDRYCNIVYDSLPLSVP
jgi:hypothetical protein